jgi:hypothetical protein
MASASTSITCRLPILRRTVRKKNQQRRRGRVTLSDSHVLAENTGKSSDRDTGERDSNAVPSPDPIPARRINEMKFADAQCRKLYQDEYVAGEGFKSKTAASVATANCLSEGVRSTRV